MMARWIYLTMMPIITLQSKVDFILVPVNELSIVIYLDLIIYKFIKK